MERPDAIFVKMSDHFELKVCIWEVISNFVFLKKNQLIEF